MSSAYAEICFSLVDSSVDCAGNLIPSPKFEANYLQPSAGYVQNILILSPRSMMSLDTGQLCLTLLLTVHLKFKPVLIAEKYYFIT